MDSSSEIPGLDFTCHQYGPHSLQRVGVWQYNSREQTPQSAYWVIFIHGGAWQDPRNTFNDFVPSLKCMLSNHDIPSAAVRGFASIDYRLCPHPDFPQSADATPATELRVAKHPEHIQDVRAALMFLDTEYSIGNDYILAGHSAGGTLAYQLIMGQGRSDSEESSVPFPTGIVGIAGIYDLVGLDDRHEGYTSFLESAFGTDHKQWDDISPATFKGNFEELWTNDRRFVLMAASTEDTLVDMPEIDNMTAKLVADGIDVSIRKNLTGDHNDIWLWGSQVSDLVAQILSQMRQT